MKISAHQPAYLPWGGFFERISMSDVFIILDDVQFEKIALPIEIKLKLPMAQHG